MSSHQYEQVRNLFDAWSVKDEYPVFTDAEYLAMLKTSDVLKG